MALHKKIQNFYASKPWRELRYNLIIERGNICNRCHKIFATNKLIGHHIIELTVDNVDDTSISLNPNNIEIICNDCHNQEHNRFGYIEHNVYIVYGSPCSGKSSYVSQMYCRGDLIVDIDRLWQALTNENKYIKPNELKGIVLPTYDYLIESVRLRKGNWRNCFIVGGFANKLSRERLAKQLNAELILIEETKEKCLENLFNDNERKDVRILWKEYIDNWFDEYVP